jgi:hypothetical protein
VGQTLRVLTANGIEDYEFAEIDFQVLSLTAFAPDFFDEPTESQHASVPRPSESTANVAAESNGSVPVVADSTNAISPPLKTVASGDLEVEILRLLNQAQADLGEEITVQRDADGPICVQGLVETLDRKSEILQVLQPVRNNPAVRIEIRTVAEAVAEQQNTPKSSSETETVESKSSATAADNELLDHFKSEEAARRFGRQMVARSNRAMTRAYALKRLTAQFKPSEFNRLSPESRSKFLTLIRSHAGAFRDECESLRRELQPVFGVANTAAAATPSIDDPPDIPRAVEALLSLASNNDRVVRSAFTLSASGPAFTAIKTSQFWQSLRAAESLAAKIQSLR